MNKNIVRKLLERNSNHSVNDAAALKGTSVKEDDQRDLLEFVEPIRKLVGYKINKKSLNLLRISVLKEFPKADEI